MQALKTKNTKKGQSEGTRKALIDAGARLFATRGFHGVSVRELTSEAGVNLATVSYHFGGKAGLYEALIDEIINRRDDIFPTETEIRAQLESCPDTPEAKGEIIDWFVSTVAYGLLGPEDTVWPTILITREIMQPSEFYTKLETNFFDPTQTSIEVMTTELLPAGTDREEIIITAQASLNMILKFIEGQPLFSKWLGWEKYDDKGLAKIVKVLSKRTRGMFGLPME